VTSAFWIAVIGPGDAAPEEAERAEAVGAEVAIAGATLVCGGLGGVMAAACRGAAAHGGMTVALLPGEDRQAANEWVQIAIPTGLGEVRNVLLVRAAHAVIAIGGGWGTLSEMALAVRAGVPVLGLDSWEPAHPRARGGGVIPVGDPRKAVREALRLGGPGMHG
jgi:uncharacterized protein (TIGR00725 family)